MEHETETSYRRIDFLVRPHKVCILIDKRVPHWKHLYRRVLEVSTTIWGGKSILIIPTDGNTIDEHNWKFLEDFSPDKLGIYTETVADMKIFDRDMYEKWADRYRQELAEHMAAQEIEKWLTENETAVNLYNFDLSDELKAELFERLQPSEDSAPHVIGQNFRYEDDESWPLTFATRILGLANEKPRRVYKPVGHADDDLDIIESMMAGRLSRPAIDALEINGIDLVTLPAKMTVGNVIADSIRRDRLNRLTSDSDEYPPDDYINQLPNSISMLCLQRAYRIAPGRESREGILVIIGDSVDDVCLAHNLGVLQENVYWLSSKLLEDAYDEFARFVKQSENNDDAEPLDERISSVLSIVRAYASRLGLGMNSDKKFEVISTSMGNSALKRRVKMMESLSGFASSFSRVRYPKVSSLDTRYGPVVMEAGNYTSQQAMVFVNRESVHVVETPKPINFKTVNIDLRWITSFTIEKYTAPRQPFTAEQTFIERAGASENRIDKEQITYMSPGISWFNHVPVDANIRTPKVRLVGAFETFEKIFAEHGYKSAISDKGMYMKHTIEKFGTLEVTAQWLKKPGVRRLLDRYTQKEQNPENRVQRNYLKFSNASYLDYNQIKLACGRNTNAAELIDEWTIRGVLKRGIILQCQRCSCVAWYEVGTFDNEFKCQRCGNKAVIAKDNWKMPEEPKWYYSLDGAVYEFYAMNGDVPLLTLDHLRAKSNHFDYVTELKLTKNGKAKFEIDIVCLVDGNIIIGESKSENLMPAHLDQLKKIEEMLRPKPVKIIFSTSHKSIEKRVMQKIKSDFRQSMTHTSKDLYS
jgi:hypothetical protein